MFETINEDLKNSLKQGDKFKLSVLRMLKSAIQLETINKKKELNDDEIISVLRKQLKQRNDSLKEYESLGKEETVLSLKNEIAIINSYLPEEVSEEVIIKVIDEIFTEINPSGMKDMGVIMKKVSEKLKNVDMAKVSSLVKERLIK